MTQHTDPTPGAEDREAPGAPDDAQAQEVPQTQWSPRRAAVLGAGSWGTTFAKILTDAGLSGPGPAPEVVLWGRDAEAMSRIARTRVNERYVPGTHLPDPLRVSSDLAGALAGADLVVLAVPAQVLRAQLAVAAPHLEADAVLVSLAKGLERGTGMRMSEVAAEVLAEQRPPGHPDGGRDRDGWMRRLCIVSGPNLAMEIADEQPTASVVAAADPQLAADVARAVAAPYFRPYTNSDAVGTEIAGLTKNVIAVCVGICDGRHYGDNSKASVITRGLAESTRLALALGGRSETMAGLAGIGDLVATCSSPLSRNRTAGRLLGQGRTLEQIEREMTQTAEGLKSAPAVLQLAREHGVDMPITEAVVAILDGRITVEHLAPLLLGRELKAEASTA